MHRSRWIEQSWRALREPLTLLKADGAPRLWVWWLSAAVLTGWLWHHSEVGGAWVSWGAASEVQTVADVVRMGHLPSLTPSVGQDNACGQKTATTATSTSTPVGACAIEALRLEARHTVALPVQWAPPRTQTRLAQADEVFALTATAFNWNEMSHMGPQGERPALSHVRLLTKTKADAPPPQVRSTWDQDLLPLTQPVLMLGARPRNSDAWLGMPPGDGLAVLNTPWPNWHTLTSAQVDWEHRDQLQFDALHLWPMPEQVSWELPIALATHLRVGQSVVLGHRRASDEGLVSPVSLLEIAALTPEPSRQTVRLLAAFDAGRGRFDFWNRIGSVMANATQPTLGHMSWVLWPTWQGLLVNTDTPRPAPIHWPLTLPSSALGWSSPPKNPWPTTARVWVVQGQQLWPVTVDVLGPVDPAPTGDARPTDAGGHAHWRVRERLNPQGGWLPPGTDLSLPWHHQARARHLQTQPLLLSTALLALHPQAHWQPGMAVDKTIAFSEGGAQ